MKPYVNRNRYLQKLIDRQNNGEVKIITGPRRCGKSWLLKKIFKDYLLSVGVPEENIIIVSLDVDDDNMPDDLTDKNSLKNYIYSQIISDNEQYYVILDEIQEVENFEKLVNGLNAKDNVDIYITGSNSKFLSNDIRTIFRGRGDEIRVHPFSFKEFCTNRTESTAELWKEYYTYGGMPGLLNQKTPEMKISYLKRLWNKTYIDDIVERNKVRNVSAFEDLVNSLCSSIGSLVNPNKVKNILKSVKNLSIDVDTIHNYMTYLEDAFLFESATRFDIKGNKYYDSIKKFYSSDIGLRNARLNFRQQEITHIMENIIFNELRCRDYLVDIGIVNSRTMKNGKSEYVQYEVDFIATNGLEKYYIQSAYELNSEEKRAQELNSLLKINDSFRKIVIVGDDIATYTDNNGIIYMGLFQFLKNEDILK